MENTQAWGTGILGCITCLSAAISAGVGAASGAIGTAILSAAGYAYPSVKTAAAMGAVGSALIGSLTGFCLAAYKCNGGTDGGFLNDPRSSILPIVGTQTLAGMLGNVMLGGVTALGKDAALSAVGSAVLSGGLIGVGALCGGGFFCYKACFNRDSAISNHHEITDMTDLGPTAPAPSTSLV